MKITDKKLKYYSINDSMMFASVMQNPEICKKFLERIFPDKKISDIKLHFDEGHTSTTEKTIVINPVLKSVRLDVLFEGDKEWYNIELQMSKKANQPLRGREYEAYMTVMQLSVGDDYNNLKTNYVIFINPFDFYGKGKAVYKFYNMEEEYGKDLPYGDRTYKIVVCTNNFEEADTPELKALLQYLNSGTVDPDDSFVGELDNLVHKLNQPDSEWRERRMTLDEFINDLVEEGVKEGIEEGLKKATEEAIKIAKEEAIKENKIETALNFKKAGVDLKTISEATGLTLKEVEEL